ncbi:CYTH and CHAD domain-containing protein [Streptomyces aurantiogriseus]|uniref:CHAD domain-containing protein n=1 Tax=Streptomyces aurantiogriseus TaxID=66870 RepID=A0A918C7M6_9ACTN|nr:CYTH and CHAD domain-containing protein [Streptomyces aurantiogriseus]GGR10610.1 CHAD domain-containing protein [Streptomyces aurantiogriseus]
MTQSTRETERKYEVPASGDFPSLTGLTGKGQGKAKDKGKGTSLVDAGTHDLDAVYYDTADLRLTRTSAILRRRTGGSDAGWHLKLPLADDTREEIRAPLQEEIPDSLSDLALSRTRGARLEPVVRIRSSRAVRDLVDADGALLAEVVLDQVRADSLRPEGGHASWAELEVELAADGDTALLERVDKALGKEGFARSTAPSKLTRALKETTPDAESAPDDPADVPSGSAGEQVLAYVSEQARTIVDLDPAVRRDLPDSVHRMRVACRRLRSCLRSYRSLLDREVTDPVRADLKWLGGELGAERDQEVLMERLREGMEALPRELVLGPAAARLQAWNASRSAEARERSLAALSSPRYVALLEALNRLTTHPPLRPKASRKPAKTLPQAILKEYDRLAGRVERARRKPPGAERDAALHEVRKGAKRLRYAGEAAGPALGKPARRLAKRAKAVQKALGDHHDSVVARDSLRRQAVAAHAAGEPGFTWGLLHGQEQATAAERERQFPQLWKRASKPRLRKALHS